MHVNSPGVGGGAERESQKQEATERSKKSGFCSQKLRARV